MRILLIGLIGLILSGQSAADNELNSWLRLGLFSSTRSLDDRNGDASFELGAKYFAELNDSNSLKFEGRAVFEEQDHLETLRLADAYWRFQRETLDIRLGQQKITWGKADGLNPTDFFTAHDYRLLQPFEADQRRSVAALRVDQNIGEQYNLSFVLEPDFVGDKLPQLPQWNIREDKPDGWRRPQSGLRWSSAGENLDWSVSAFRGYLNAPILAVDQMGFYNRYTKLNAIGADIAHNFGRVGFRGEIARLDPEKIKDQFSPLPQTYAIAGVDTGSDRWNVNLQLLWRHTSDWQNLNQQLDLVNAINQVQWEKNITGVTSRLAYNGFNQTVEFELLCVQYLHPDNRYIRPLINYAITDKKRLTLGGEYYSGPDLSLFGALELNKVFYLEYKQLL